MEVEWKWSRIMHPEWKYLGIRMELVEFYSGSTVEGSGPYKPP